MVRKINLKIEIIVHATEDYQKISDSLFDVFEIESNEITKKEFLGHFGNPILMLHVQMKNGRAEELIKKLISTISQNNIKSLLADIEERISDSTLYLRFSKQNFVKKNSHISRKRPSKNYNFHTSIHKKEYCKNLQESVRI